MSFNPRGKSIKDIQDAYQEERIQKAAILAEFTERLNRPGKGHSWKIRYEQAIVALKEDKNLVDGAFQRSTNRVSKPTKVSAPTKAPSKTTTTPASSWAA